MLLAGCTHNISPLSLPSHPGIGSSYTVISQTSINSRMTYDTSLYTVDSINLNFMGRNYVTRFEVSKNGQIHDTFYINYLPSGDIETYTQSYYSGPTPWFYYPFATQKNSVTVFDTSWYFGTQVHSVIDTTFFSPAGLGHQTIQGVNYNDERVLASVSLMSQGTQGESHGLYTYISDISFIGLAVDTIINGGQTSISTREILSYNLK